jgi:hypothetical protein
MDESSAVFKAMLEGWDRQQRSRYFREDTIGARARIVSRFAEFTGQYPWQWGPGEVEAFTSALVSGKKPLAHSTVRSYQMALQLFCAFVTDVRYGCAEECDQRFGGIPVQVCHEWNTVAHVAEHEGQPGRRALTYDEVQALFDAADSRRIQSGDLSPACSASGQPVFRSSPDTIPVRQAGTGPDLPRRNRPTNSANASSSPGSKPGRLNIVHPGQRREMRPILEWGIWHPSAMASVFPPRVGGPAQSATPTAASCCARMLTTPISGPRPSR